MSLRPKLQIRFARFGGALACAALLTATQATAQTPETAAGQTPTPLLAPVNVPVENPVNTSVESSTETRLPEPEDGGAAPDTPAADSDTLTQPTPDPATQTTAPPERTPEPTSPSEPPNRWLAADPADDPAPKTNPGNLETGTTAIPVLAEPISDPLAQARSRWRGAVAAEKTDLGFRAWILAALGEDADAPHKDDDIEARAPTPAAPMSATPVDSQASRTRDVSGRWLARAGPVALGAAGRVVTTFGAAIPTAFCAPLIVCYIELEPGEMLTDTPSWGDTARWQVTVKYQGRDPETVILEIKPSKDAGLTNLVIPTDRRLYTINLLNDPEVHTPILSFIYPDTAERVAAEHIAARKAQDASAAATATAARAAHAAAHRARLANTGVETSTGLRDPGQLDFRFSVSGTAPFRPVRVYTDGRKTYIDLHPGYRGPLPIVAAGAGEENKALNTRVAGGGQRLVVDRVIRDIWLQAGSRKVRIRRAAP